MKNDNIKIIFTDVDWTILDHSNNKHKFDKKSIKSLIKAQKNGVLVYIATARPYHSLLKTGFFDLFTPDGLICTNGSVVFCGKNLIRNDIYKKEEVCKIISVCNKYNLVVEVSTEKDRFFTLETNDYVKEYFKVYHETYPKVKKYHNENVSALLIFAPKDYDSNLVREIGRNFDFYRFTEYGIDLRKHPVYKSQGVNAVLNYLNISKDNALAIGDENGDVSMFEWCKFSSCIGNRSELAKFKASFVSDDVTHHGVKKALKYFKVI